VTGPPRRPPAFWSRLLAGVLPRDEGARLSRELDELYAARRERHGDASARAWYRRQVIAFAATALWRGLGVPVKQAREAARDLTLAARSLSRSPGLAVTTLATLSLGIGTSTLVFSLVDRVLLRPLAYPDPERLVAVGNFATRGELDVIRTEMRSLEEARGYMDLDLGVNLQHDGGAERLATSFVEPGLFDMLGASPLLGRLFLPEEAGVGRTDVTILGEALWRSRFGADPGILGGRIILDGRAHEVVGVLPAGWSFPGSKDQLWLPLEWDPTQIGPFWGAGGLRVVGRLAPGATPSSAQKELRALSPELARRNPLWSPSSDYRSQSAVTPLREALTGDARGSLMLLLSAVSVMLLAVCANVSGLLLARALDRLPLVALRAALGASRTRLGRESLAEGVLLGLAGAAGGALVAWVALEGLRSTLLVQIPRASEISIDGRVLAAATILGVATGLVASSAPTLRALRGDPGSILREGGRGGGMGRRRAILARVLVTGQIAAAVALVTSAGLLARSLAEIGRVDPGFRTDGVLTAEVTFPSSSDPGSLTGTYASILERVRASPGVTAAAMAGSIPFGRRDELYATMVDGADLDPNALPMIDSDRVSPGYFATLDVPLLEGRLFDGQDREDSRPVAMVDELMARTYWPERSPIGGRLRYPWSGAPWLEVVGVVGSVADDRLAEARRPRWYVPLAQNPTREVTLVVATQGAAASLSPAVRSAVARVNDALPLSRVSPYGTLVGDSESRTVLTTRLLAGFAIVALLLGCLGVYGVAAQAVRERTREIGVRMALGAASASIGAGVLKDGLALALPGAFAGLLGAVAAKRILQVVLVEVKALDPLVLAGVPILVGLAAVAALWLPARRAARVDPVHVLRRS
jgi:putative ABC transport system permease protein